MSKDAERTVGQIMYKERFKRSLDLVAARSSLIDRFGTPEKEQSVATGRMMQWSDNKQRIQIKVSNSAEGVVGYRSTIQFGLWSRQHEKNMAALNKHCAELRKTPPHKMTSEQKMQVVQDCIM